MTDPFSSPELHGPVAVTGATGFVGRALTARLVEQGIVVRALLRRQDVKLPAAVERIQGDLADPAAIDHLIADTSLVVHCAGAVRGASREAFDRVNVAGTEMLLARVGQVHPGVRLIHLSSLAARAPELSHYAASKRAAEDLYGADTRCRWTLLRPTAIYGPGDRELLPLLKAMARGWAFVPGVAEARVTLIHIDDAVAAILAAAASVDCIDGCFEIADNRPDGYAWSELCAAVATLRGRKVRAIPVPTALLSVLGKTNLGLSRILHRAPMLTPGKVRELTHPDWSCDTAAFRQASGWTPRMELQRGLASVLGDS